VVRRVAVSGWREAKLTMTLNGEMACLSMPARLHRPRPRKAHHRAGRRSCRPRELGVATGSCRLPRPAGVAQVWDGTVIQSCVVTSTNLVSFFLWTQRNHVSDNIIQYINELRAQTYSY
jgi:hypothetical protein